MNKILQQYTNTKQLRNKDVLNMFNSPDGVLHGIRKDTIGIDEDGQIICGNIYYSAIKVLPDKPNKIINCIIHFNENEHIIQLLMSHSEQISNTSLNRLKRYLSNQFLNRFRR